MAELNKRDLRSAFGSFMTGVTVVTAHTAKGVPVGFTANSFSSVSMEPPLVLVCPGKFLSSFGDFETCSHFAISVLAEGQEEISNLFASYKGDRFARVNCENDVNGVPVVQGAVSRFSCTTHQVVPAGDHIVLIGEVTDFAQSSARGLGYAAGSYFSLGLELDAGLPSSDGLVPYLGAIIEWNGMVYLEDTGAGFTLPSFELGQRGNLRAALADDLERAGMQVRLDRVYSVYDDVMQNRHHTYFRAVAEAPRVGGAGRYVPIGELPGLTFAAPSQATMMTRFSLEHQTRDLGL